MRVLLNNKTFIHSQYSPKTNMPEETDFQDDVSTASTYASQNGSDKNVLLDNID